MKKRYENIEIGPLVDGKKYRYNSITDSWHDDEGPAHTLPYLYRPEEGNAREVLFHTETHKWTNLDGLILPTGISDEIDHKFRKEYKLNGQVRLLSLKEPEDSPEQDDRGKTPAIALKDKVEETQYIDVDELLKEAKELQVVRRRDS